MNKRAVRKRLQKLRSRMIRLRPSLKVPGDVLLLEGILRELDSICSNLEQGNCLSQDSISKLLENIGKAASLVKNFLDLFDRD